MGRLFLSIGFVIAVSTPVAFAQTVTIGNLPPTPNFGFNATPVVITAIDLATPAPVAATLTSAAFTWSAIPCSAAVKIKFFRRIPTGALTLLTERGPYDVTSFTPFIFLSPPVAVQPGDFIGIARVAPCGSPVGQSPGAPDGFLAFAADVTGSVMASQGTLFANATLSVRASGTADAPSPSADPAAVVPVVGSTRGAIGESFFRTSVQLHNPRTVPVSGNLVYHSQGTSGTPSDPSTPYSLAPGETRSIADLLPFMGLTGLGSLDLVPAAGSELPVVFVRVFNDAGSLGTTGFVEELVTPGEALGAGDRGILVGPIDTVFFRFNVGVRTLGAGATLSITVRNSGGGAVHSLTRSYAPHWFEQRDSTSFLEGAVLGANDTISVQVVSGSAIVYGATVDNRTQDPSMQIVRRLP